MSQHVLNREFLLSGRLAEEIRKWSPETRVLSDEEKAARERRRLEIQADKAAVEERKKARKAARDAKEDAAEQKRAEKAARKKGK